MRMGPVSLVVVVACTTAFCATGGLLEKVTKIQVDPTVIERPEKVRDAMAANLVRYNLRAAVRDARIEEGDSPIRAHFVLDEFSTESAARRLVGLNSGRSTSTVDGRLVIQDANGKELANIRIHVHGTVAFSPDDSQDHHVTSDFEERLLKEIEMLK